MAASCGTNKETTQELLAFLINNKTLSDVTFLLGDEGKEQQKFFAHKFVLAAHSEVFETRFYGPLAEKSELICIPDVTPKPFLTMLRYLYADDVKFESLQHAMETYNVAKKYMIRYLQVKCQNYIENILVPDNACEVYEFACRMRVVSLMLGSLKMFSNETTDVLASDGFRNAALTTVQKIVRKSSLDIPSEGYLFNHVLAWAKNATARNGLHPDPVNVRATMQPLLPYIRFLAMDAFEVADGPVKERILTPEEVYAILLGTDERNISIFPMPENFSLCHELRSSPPDLYSYKASVTSPESQNYKLFPNNIFLLELTVRSTDAFLMGVRLPVRALKESEYDSTSVALNASVKCVNVDTRKVINTYDCKCNVNSNDIDAEIKFPAPVFLEAGEVMELRVTLLGQIRRCFVKRVYSSESTPKVTYDDLELSSFFLELEGTFSKYCFPISEILFYY